MPKGRARTAIKVEGGYVYQKSYDRYEKLVNDLGATLLKVKKLSLSGIKTQTDKLDTYLELKFEGETYTVLLRSLDKGVAPWNKPTQYSRWNVLYPKGHVIYKFLDAEGCVIYIGKSSNIKDKMGSHFRRGSKRKAWIDEVKYLEVSQFDSESDMHLLEVYLILKHKPKYNIDCYTSETLNYVLPEPLFDRIREY